MVGAGVIEIEGARIDRGAVTAVRAGNALWPGLSAFTGVTFLVYLSVKGLSGATPVDGALFGQLAFSAALLALGGAALARGRYFFVELREAGARRKFSGLTKARQQEIVAALGSAEAAQASGGASGA